LQALIAAGHEIPLVVSQPDRPVGRSQELTAPPVKETAAAAGLEVTQPEKIKNNLEFRTRLEAIAPDAIIVVAYGRIIPPWMLALPRLGCINLHASLLPKYRGAAPIQWAVAMGEAVTGNTTMLLEEGLDTGPILLQREIAIGPEQTAVDLFDVLAKDGAPLVVETLAGLEDGTVVPKQQDHARATLAPILDRKDGRMDFAGRTATEIWNRWRGFQPWPGAYTTLDGKKLIAHRVRVDGKIAQAVAGTVDFADHRFLVACAQNTWIEITELQMEGKKRMSATDFLRGAGLRSGIRLG
jgi:methionyl-tRNA formyltransferase